MIQLRGVRTMLIHLTTRAAAVVVALTGNRLQFDDSQNSIWLGVI